MATTDTSRPRPVEETEAWARDLTELRLAIEEMTAGIGGLLEHWPVSPEQQRERLEALFEVGARTRGVRVKPRAWTEHECPDCGARYPKCSQRRIRRCLHCRLEAAAAKRRSA